jgi:hypothetical protein
MPLLGQLRFFLIAGGSVILPAGVLGGGGTTTTPIGQAQLSLTGAPWITGGARITNITTNVISIPARPATGVAITLQPAASETVKTFTTFGGFVSTNPSGNIETRATVTVWGGNDLHRTPSGVVTGGLQLIAPARISASPVFGNLPVVARMRLNFVPEPGMGIGLGSAAILLALLGWRRSRRREPRCPGGRRG